MRERRLDVVFTLLVSRSYNPQMYNPYKRRAVRRPFGMSIAGRGRSRSYLRRGGMPRSMAGRYRTINSSRPRVRATVAPELKNWDQAFTMSSNTQLTPPAGAGVASGAVGAVIVGLAQGTTQNQRIGRAIRLKSVLVNATMTLTPSGGSGSDVGHMFLVLDTQSNGVLPVAADIWSSAVAGGQLRNLDTEKRFKILKHLIIPVEADAGVSGAYETVIKGISLYYKFPKGGLNVSINSTAGAFSEFKENNVYLVFGSTNGFCNIAAPSNSRIRYTDC